MSEIIYCNKCYRNIEVEDYTNDYSEHEQEATLAVVECSRCKHKNAIYWETTVEFYSRDADNDDIDIHNDRWWEELELNKE